MEQMRVMGLERELEYVRSDRDRQQLYLNRIMKEVNQKVNYSCVLGIWWLLVSKSKYIQLWNFILHVLIDFLPNRVDLILTIAKPGKEGREDDPVAA